MITGKRTKTFIAIVLWLLAGLAFLFTLMQVLFPDERTVENAVFTADTVSSVDYSIRLKNTPIYDRAKDADPAKYYVLPFTDYITVDCKYTYNSQNAANISVNSYVTAFLVSYIDEGNEEVIIWKKEYALSELETNESAGSEISGEKQIRLELDEYTSLIDQIYDTYSFKTKYYLMVLYSTEFTADYGGKTVNKIQQPYIRIDLDELLYGIQENNLSKGKLEITQQSIVDGEISWDAVIVGGTVFLFLAALAVLVPRKMIASADTLGEAKQIRQINIKYGDRIVHIKEKPALDHKAIMVADMEDVIKIADEIGQPIFSIGVDSEVYYYVVNNNVMYYVVVKNV